MIDVVFLSLVFLAPTFPQDSHAPAAARANVASAAGNWLGTIEVGGAKIRLGFHLKQDEDRDWSGTVDSPDQNVMGTKLSRVDIDEDGSAFIAIKAWGAKFDGRFEGEPPRFVGTFSQLGRDVPLVLERVERIDGPNRPQEPKPPFPYRVEEVSYESLDADVELAASLTLPEGAGPFPAVVMITGSGPQDRDETLAGHKPFAVIADFLTRRGIAVLRADDRGTAASTGSFPGATTFDFAKDAEGGVNFLKRRPEIDPKRIGLIGHSEGGIIAPIVAARSSDVAFIVMLAGTGIPGDEILRMQTRLMAKAAGTDDATLDLSESVNVKLYEIVKREPAGPALVGKLVAKIDEEKRGKTAAEQRVCDGLKASVPALANVWNKAFLSYDPRPTLEKVKCPVLALNGSKDLQVPPKENLAGIAAALKSGGNADVTVTEIPGLNHMFQPTETGAPIEYQQIPTTFDPGALSIIGDWITKRFGKKA